MIAAFGALCLAGMIYLYVGLARDYARLERLCDALRNERDWLVAQLPAAPVEDNED